MPDMNFPAFDINKAATEINNALRDGAYVAVGLGVLGFQRAQVHRVELTKQIEAQLGDWEEFLATAREQAETQVHALRTQLTGLARTIDERVAPLRSAVGLG